MIIFNEQKNQLCNRLFAFLPSNAFAIENQEKMLILFFSEKYLSAFPNLSNHPLLRFSLSCKEIYPQGLFKIAYVILKSLSKLLVMGRQNFSFTKVSRKKTRLLFVRGWKYRYAPSYVREHYQTLKSLFEPHAKVKMAISESFPKGEGNIVVGVHIRRGDYHTYKNGLYYYSDDVYRRYMDQLRDILIAQEKKVWFLLCSNEPISPEVAISYATVNLPGNDYITDLYALSCCDYIIGPPSTFSQWASFIGQVPLKVIHKEEEQICMTDFNYILSIDRFNTPSECGTAI